MTQNSDENKEQEIQDSSPVQVLTKALDSEGKLTNSEQKVIIDELTQMDSDLNVGSTVMLDAISNEDKE